MTAADTTEGKYDQAVPDESPAERVFFAPRDRVDADFMRPTRRRSTALLRDAWMSDQRQMTAVGISGFVLGPFSSNPSLYLER